MNWKHGGLINHHAFFIFIKTYNPSIMKKIICLSALLFISYFLFADDEKRISNSEVKEVKVYLNGAMVTRKVKTTVEAGITKIYIDNLSAQINASNINVTGTGDLTIYSVSAQTNYLNQKKKTPEIISLEDSLDAVTYRHEQLLNAKAVYMDEQDMILANKNINGANVGVKPDDLVRVADFYRSRLS